MGFNPYIGRSVEWLLEALEAAQDDDVAGATITRTGAGDTMTESRVDKSPRSRIIQLYAALRIADPNNAQWAAANTTPIDRVRVRFDYCVTIPFP